jgi:hypothetical protein
MTDDSPIEKYGSGLDKDRASEKGKKIIRANLFEKA